MKSIIKATTVFLFGIMISGLIASCDNEDVNLSKSNLDDAQLIEAIQNSTNKVAVNPEDLPASSLNVLEQDYSTSYTENAHMTPDLGYEVSLREGKGSYVGEQFNTYFDVNGRELLADGGEGGPDRPDGPRKGKKGRECFDFVLPVTFTMADGSSITVEDEEGWKAIKAWYDANPDTKERPSVQFPVDITYKDGTTTTINNEEELKAAHEACKGEMGDLGKKKGPHDGQMEERRCFDFVLPITFIMPDNTEITIATEEDWKQMKAWHDENPDVEERPTLVFPIDIIFKADSSTLTINNDEEMKGLKERCEEYRKDEKGRTRNIIKEIVHIDGCEYPVSGTFEVLENGVVVEVVDFGDGTCDNIANRTVDGVTTEFELKEHKEGGERGEKGKGGRG